MTPDQTEYLIKLYNTYFQAMKRMATPYLGSAALAEELVQDTFHDAVRQIDTLAAHPAPYQWLLKVCKNKISYYYKTKKRDQALVEKLKRQAQVEPSEAESAEGAVEARLPSGSAAEEKIRSRLSPEEWEFLRRITLEDASHLEMAKELGISVWTSQKRLERIRDKLGKDFPGYRKKKILTIFLILCQVLLFEHIL